MDGAAFSDPYHNCITTNNYYANSYKQYDSTTGNIICCRFPYVGPTEIAINQALTTAPTITQYQNYSKGPCLLTTVPATTHPELYDSIEIEYDIFNKIYINNLGLNQTSADLVPTYTNSNVSCLTGYIPLVIEYNLTDTYKRYARFCATASYISQISFINFDYNIYRYLDLNSNTPCTSNVCNTTYAPFLGFNLEPAPVNSNNSNSNNSKTITYIISGVVAIFVIFLLTLLLLYRHKIDKKNINKNKINKNYNYKR